MFIFWLAINGAHYSREYVYFDISNVSTFPSGHILPTCNFILSSKYDRKPANVDTSTSLIHFLSEKDKRITFHIPIHIVCVCVCENITKSKIIFHFSHVNVLFVTKMYDRNFQNVAIFKKNMKITRFEKPLERYIQAHRER